MGIRIFEKDTNCVTRQVGTETIIVPVRASAADLRAVYTLNESATEIWHRIDGHASVQQLVDELCSVYEVSPSAAERDVGELLDTLSSAGLIYLTGDHARHAL
jgi:hypothetical protein